MDADIARAAEQTLGYIGKRSWIAADGDARNSVYYWKDDAALRAFSRHPLHLEAKRRYKEWYTGFNVEIARIEKTYGDGQLESLLPNQRQHGA